MSDLWSIQDDLPGEHSAREYLEAAGFPPDVADEMDDERAAFEAEFPPVDLDSIPACDPWGMASQWGAGDDDESEVV